MTGADLPWTGPTVSSALLLMTGLVKSKRLGPGFNIGFYIDSSLMRSRGNHYVFLLDHKSEKWLEILSGMDYPSRDETL